MVLFQYLILVFLGMLLLFQGLNYAAKVVLCLCHALIGNLCNVTIFE